MQRPEVDFARDARAAAACALAWALTLTGWLALGALGRATTPLWFDGLAPLACWLALGVVFSSRPPRRDARDPEDHVVTLAAGLVAASAFVWAARGGSAAGAFVAAAAWAALSGTAWRAARGVAAAASTRIAWTAIVPAVAGAALAWAIAADLDGGMPMSIAARLALFLLTCAVLLPALSSPRAEDAGAQGCAATIVDSSEPRRANSWAVAAARWTMLPMMAAMVVDGDWCASGSVTAHAAMALHFAAMFVPALLATLIGGAWRPLRGSAAIATLMIAGLAASFAWPGARGWKAMSLLHAAAWSLAWAQALRREAVAQAATAPNVAIAALPAFAALALGALLSRFGIAGLVAVHVGLGVVSAAGAIAWTLRAARPLKEMHS